MGLRGQLHAPAALLQASTE